MYRHFMGICRLSRRSISSSARQQVDNTVKSKQLFQEDNCLPTHLKGGSKDALLYRTTMAVTVFGSGFVLFELFNASMPKNPQWNTCLCNKTTA
ncbi:cytochrome c oxidase subunit 7A2, mitochondrial-like [Sphaeramia orbicularis]|uniref:Cytochrome c oxidase subunit 7A2, mitochondrial n=1 Tax=Sphaeramia orbicularis TaxID=375764 RepID=A0A673B6Z2_9TELE|nr:cytochrome c oxidase subunit 7A2, mitochondrial-like [Sphaeramia orbicularis]